MGRGADRWRGFQRQIGRLKQLFEANPGRTYRFFTGAPVLPFGFGLSYTTWAYTPLPDPTPPTINLAAVDAAARAQEATGVLGHIPAALKEAAAQFWDDTEGAGVTAAFGEA